jgi:hypothetical protein
MFYTLLGRLVWTFAKRRYRGRAPARRALLTGLAGSVAVAAGAAIARQARARRQRQS